MSTLLVGSLVACGEDKDPLDSLTTNMTVGPTGETSETGGATAGGTTEGDSTGGDSTGGATDTGCSGPGCPAIETDISGEFLLAISTVVAPDLPIQFISTNKMTIDMGGSVTMTSDLQPLALLQGKVTLPRTPIGDPLHYGPVPVVAGEFSLDAGLVMVPGMANPITGGDGAMRIRRHPRARALAREGSAATSPTACAATGTLAGSARGAFSSASSCSIAPWRSSRIWSEVGRSCGLSFNIWRSAVSSSRGQQTCELGAVATLHPGEKGRRPVSSR